MTISSYQVLARKYRPLKFADLVGHDVLLRTLTNAFKQGRVPHAILLTGTRGIGKTTTARLIARALNCGGPDGNGLQGTIEPCGVCQHCVDILNDRHLDVLEMDAASRNGIDDIRGLIETVAYKPTSARYKVYIIDEVHMLSKSAFNALLKTLEEPPAHVKFIFATTEFHKIPDTIVSRCMRFDLKAFDLETLGALVDRVCAQEGFEVEAGAKWMIAKAGNGSARDTLSLLERALTLGEGKLSLNVVQDMLGMADGQGLLSLIEHLAKADASKAMTQFTALIEGGADAQGILNEIALCLHELTLMKSGINQKNSLLSEKILEGLATLAPLVHLASVMRLWQVVQKGLHEISLLSLPRQGAEMVLMRLCYLGMPLEQVVYTAPQAQQSQDFVAQAPPAPKVSLSKVDSFDQLIALCTNKKEPLLKAFLEHDVALVSFDSEASQMVLKLLPQGDKETLTRLRTQLNTWTGATWGIELCDAGVEVLSLKQQEKKAQKELVDAAGQDPVVQKILTSFPGSQIAQVDVMNTDGVEKAG